MTGAPDGRPEPASPKRRTAGRRTIQWVLVGVVVGLLAAGIALAIAFLPRAASSAPDGAPTAFTAASFRTARRIVDYEQPSPELAQAISIVHRAEDGDPREVPASLSGLDVVIVDGVLFYRYWQNPQDDYYVFHPMALGRCLVRMAADPGVSAYLDRAVQVAHRLPNGGLLWYYPDRYTLTRFLGPDLAPSAIAQGIILEGITATDKAVPADLSELARSVFQGLAFDYYRGGLNLAGLALLEIPLFRSPPEIILNGWLDALLHLRSYIEEYDDHEARRLFESNVRFLARSLDRFHDPESGLSRYSDLCPYRVSVEWDDAGQRELTAFYRSRVRELDDLAFDLVEIENPTRSAFDNQVIRETPTGIEAWVSCSQEYDTYLVSTSGPFTVRFAAGVYEPEDSTPGAGGTAILIPSALVDGHHVAHLTSIRDELFCGYPTNFTKNGVNSYHAYHVVALACLLAVGAVPHDLAPTVGHWMNRWLEAAEATTPEKGLTFAPFQTILGSIIRNGAHLPSGNWDDLLALARDRIP